MTSHSHSSNTDVLISEVGPRDGLQSVASVMPTEHKKRWISALHAAGFHAHAAIG
jgi:hydroxymethylglutaryl-CoA lyase